MILRRLAALRDADRGAATVEFALWSCLFFVIILVSLDFAMYRMYQIRLGSAVEQGAMLSFNARDSLNQGNGGTIRAYVAASSGLPGTAPTVSMNCNNGTANCVSTNRPCRCITGAGPTWGAETTCGSICPGGSTAGYYLTLRANYTYTPVVIPNSWLESRAMTARAVVRLK